MTCSFVVMPPPCTPMPLRRFPPLLTPLGVASAARTTNIGTDIYTSVSDTWARYEPEYQEELDSATPGIRQAIDSPMVREHGMEHGPHGVTTGGQGSMPSQLAVNPCGEPGTSSPMLVPAVVAGPDRI